MKIIVNYKSKTKETIVSQEAIDAGKSAGMDVVAELASVLLTEIKINLICEIINDDSIDSFFKYQKIDWIYKDIQAKNDVTIEMKS